MMSFRVDSTRAHRFDQTPKHPPAASTPPFEYPPKMFDSFFIRAILAMNEEKWSAVRVSVPYERSMLARLLRFGVKSNELSVSKSGLTERTRMAIANDSRKSIRRLLSDGQPLATGRDF